MNREEKWQLQEGVPDIKDQKRWRVIVNEEGDHEIKGKRGHITQYPDGNLNVWLIWHRPSYTDKIKKMGWKPKNHYDDGALFIRPYSDLDLAAKLLKCPKRRQVTETQRLKLKEWSEKHGFQKSNASQGA